MSYVYRTRKNCFLVFSKEKFKMESSISDIDAFAIQNRWIEIVRKTYEYVANDEIILDCWTYDQIISSEKLHLAFFTLACLDTKEVKFAFLHAHSHSKSTDEELKELETKFALVKILNPLEMRYTQKISLKKGVRHTLRGFSIVECFTTIGSIILTLRINQSNLPKYSKQIVVNGESMSGIRINFCEKMLPIYFNQLTLEASEDCEILVTGILANEIDMKRYTMDFLEERGFRTYL